MAFDLKDHSLPTTDIHHTGSFARALQYVVSFSGKFRQDWFGVFVAAVLRPQNGKEARFRVVGQAA